MNQDSRINSMAIIDGGSELDYCDNDTRSLPHALVTDSADVVATATASREPSRMMLFLSSSDCDSGFGSLRWFVGTAAIKLAINQHLHYFALCPFRRNSRLYLAAVCSINDDPAPSLMVWKVQCYAMKGANTSSLYLVSHDA